MLMLCVVPFPFPLSPHNSLHPQAPPFSITQALELLWTSLEEWLHLLKNEIRSSRESSTGSVSVSSLESLTQKTTSLSISRTPSDSDSIISTSSVELRRPGSDRSLSESVGAEIERDTSPVSSRRPTSSTGEALLEDGTALNRILPAGESAKQAVRKLGMGQAGPQQQQDIISAIAPRISAVIQAFYMCCSCQMQWR